MIPVRCVTGLLVGLLLAMGIASAQPAADSPAGVSRVAVLPFADYANASAVVPEIMDLVRGELRERGVELVEPSAVSGILRRHRIRNTYELTGVQLETITTDLAAGYVLVGAVECYVQAEEGGEVALAARLIAAPAMTVEWTGTASRHTLNGLRLLGQGRERQTTELARAAVRSMFRNFAYGATSLRPQVEWVQLGAGRHAQRHPCERVLVLPFANETGHFSAGGIFTGRLMAALPAAGFEVVEPGLVREAMLAEGTLARGGASAELLQICREQLHASFVLTGTVSRFDCATGQSLDQIPAVSVEARLIDVRSGEVVWARTERRDSETRGRLFGAGTVYDVTSVADRVAAKLVRSIPAHRSRGT